MKKTIFMLLFASACATQPPVATQPQCNPGLALVNAAAWLESSAEYRASALQTYAVARQALDAALQTQSDKPAAVILDLDETAIQNSPFEARMIKQGKTYDAAGWSQWVSESASSAIPGAAEFVAYAKARGVTPFYITNRKAEEETATRATLQKLGFPLDANEDTVLTRGERREWSAGDKGPRRDYVAARYRVLLLLGDDLNDFIAAQGKSIDERLELIRANADKWGKTWFILPNPVYGSWEVAAAGSGAPCEQLNRKVENLKQ